jgi:hypothetical protein
MPRKPKPSFRTYERKADEHAAITPVEYGGLQEAYDHFNKALFGSKLPDVFITYQRQAHSKGYFAVNRFAGRNGGNLGRHELALNPDTFVDRTDEQICSTLAHEQAHVWQHAFGKPSARGYHNKEWAAKMKAIGLQPSSTGAVGGKETGQRVTHYIIPDGPFARAFAKLAETRWKLNLQSAHHAGGNKAPNQGEIHLSRVRPKRLGQARPRHHLHTMRNCDAAATRRRKHHPYSIVRNKKAGAGASRLKTRACRRCRQRSGDSGDKIVSWP